MWDTKPDVPNEVKGGENLGTSVINPHFDSPAVIEEQKKTDALNERIAAEREDYDEPDKAHEKQTSTAIKLGIKDLKEEDLYQTNWNDLTKDQQDQYQLEMNKAKGTQDVRYPFYGANEGIDRTFKEHWDNAVIVHPALKYSLAGRLLYATGKNIAEFATDKGLLGFDRDVNDPSGEGPAGGASAGGNYGGNVNPLQEYAGREYKDQPYASSTPSGGDGGDSISSLITAPQTPYIATGNTPASNSVAANWYYGLGQTSTNPGGFNLATEYAAAKTKVAQTLGTPSSYGWLAVNNSPFYNWLKTNSLDKGIL
jgi:hypothetical protein